MIPGAFDYHRPSTVAEAVTLLADAGEDGRVLAGGHSLIPMMKLRMATPETLIDLRHIDELRGIDENGGTITIGAMTTQAEMIASGLLADVCPILRETALQIADPQIRNLGTVGGNVANGDPGNDLPALMQALDATYLVAGKSGSREIAARDFYEAAYFTALQDGEVLTAIRIAAPPAGHGWAYEKQKRKIGDYATAAAAVLLTMSGGKCASAAIALTNVGDTPLYAEAAGAALVGTDLGDDAVNAAVAAAEAIAEPAEDGRGPVDFRIKIAGQMVRRGIARAASRAS
jgi:aerobic carbon-monoxide dehydrogenase medium subunit